MLFWKRAARPFAAVVGLVVDVIDDTSESCCRVCMDVKRISIFLDCVYLLGYHKKFYLENFIIFNIFIIVKYITCLNLVILCLLL